MEDQPRDSAPDLPPYVIEGARSGRSKCKTCRRAINKGSLRIGFLIEGPFGAGYLWHHLTCAGRRHFDRVAEAYELESWKAAKEPPAEVPDLEELRKLQEQAEERRRKRKTIPYAEIDPSGRARCKHCNGPLEKGGLRVILGREVEFGNQVRVGPINVHARCVAAELQAADCGTPVEGFAEALRGNSVDLPAEKLDAVLDEIGELR